MAGAPHAAPAVLSIKVCYKKFFFFLGLGSKVQASQPKSGAERKPLLRGAGKISRGACLLRRALEAPNPPIPRASTLDGPENRGVTTVELEDLQEKNLRARQGVRKHAFHM